MNDCTTCANSGESLVYSLGCFRPKRFASGRVLRAPPGVGFAPSFETGHADIYEGRDDGDCCGETRRRWSAKK